jgi:hypothetical protein
VLEKQFVHGPLEEVVQLEEGRQVQERHSHPLSNPVEDLLWHRDRLLQVDVVHVKVIPRVAQKLLPVLYCFLNCSHVPLGVLEIQTDVKFAHYHLRLRFMIEETPRAGILLNDFDCDCSEREERV